MQLADGANYDDDGDGDGDGDGDDNDSVGCAVVVDGVKSLSNIDVE